jgi:hypothetical protein
MAYAERRDLLVKKSRIEIVTSDNGDVPQWTYLSFFGPIARIPSLKNSKSAFAFIKDGRAKVGMSKSSISEAWVRAATVLFEKALFAAGRKPFRYDCKVSGFAVHGKRSSNFDVDNATTTLQDFLEPREKQVGSAKKQFDRGWGCGLVEDDKDVRLFPLLAADFGFSSVETTVVILSPFENVKEHIFKAYAAHFCGAPFMVNEESQRQLWEPELIKGGK